MNKDPNYKKHLEQGRQTQKLTWIQIKENYYKNPVRCIECKEPIPFKKRTKSKFCSSSCSAKFNNRRREKKKKICPICKTKFEGRTRRKYCSLKCSCTNAAILKAKKEFEIATTLALNGYTQKIGINTLKRIIKNRDGNKCSICSMPAEWEFKTIVLILDHIDGNSENNELANLRLVCPNCDSQLPTFKARNKGNGRYYRRQRYKQGKSY